MKINEEALKEVFKKNVLYICMISLHAQSQISEYIKGNIPLTYFDDETKKELSDFYNVIKNAYYLETNEYIPNIFAQLED